MSNQWQQTVRLLTLENIFAIMLGLVVLQQFSPIHWSVALVGALLLAVLVLAVFEGAFVWYQQKERQKTIDRMESKLRQMSSQQFPPHILLPQSDPLYSLSQAVNQLESYQRSQTRRAELQEKELMMIMRYLPVGVMVIDHHRQVQLSNPAMSELLHQSINTVAHLYTKDIQLYALTKVIEDTIATQKNQRATITLTPAPNTQVVEATTVFIQNSRSHFQIVLMLYDITEVYMIEQMQDDFVSNASHELKTPITAIAGFTETLLGGAKDDPETLDQFLKIIADESQRLIDLIQDVLSLSRIRAQNTTKLTMQSVKLKRLVSQELSVQQQAIEQRHLTVEANIDDAIAVVADQQKLGQIVKNLISNAIKYNRPGGTVTISATASPEQWYLTVKDTGIGISADDQQRIFERFYRASPSRSQQVVSGTGLGLAIVKELVTAMHGQISVMSQRGVGTTMTVTLPLKPTE
ncbi:two-component system histidine kinase PnpS [Lactiplantibacillus fabifermentans]|uniref:histidine kinase n=2 Tax=Lactiplantibacillus fabifermentans TaxID=483011 RepID=A0A0R2NP68_9LACO|nr:HAMP domain-containing sensor histidine kinase [Lactiplantibacillus fabifermentans]ETY75273.1 histidine kinase [Lactiplantibacillus fabifermentans T30PCM01]KRO27521.1 histidine protein kinase [Lactiplantibacillus fabifermentans DSM 21115]